MRSHIVLVVLSLLQVFRHGLARNERRLVKGNSDRRRRRRRRRRKTLPSWIDDLDDYRQQQTDKYSFGLGQVTVPPLTPVEDSRDETDSSSSESGGSGGGDSGGTFNGSSENDVSVGSTDELILPFIDFAGQGSSSSSEKWTSEKDPSPSRGKGKGSGKGGKGKKSSKKSDKGKGKGGGSGKKSKQKGKGKGYYYYDEEEDKSRPDKRPIGRPTPLFRPNQPVTPPQRRPILMPSPTPLDRPPSVRPPQRPVFPPPTRAPTPRLPSPLRPAPVTIPTRAPVVPPMALPTVSPEADVDPTRAPEEVATVRPTARPSDTVTLPPSVATISTAPVVVVEEVVIPPYYIAYVAPLAEREPTDDEYLLIMQLTTLYFEEIFAALYADDPSVNFVRVDTVIDTTLFEAGIPAPEFNLYMAFETSIVFSAVSRELPTAADLFSVMDESIGTSYIVDYVWQAPETPFISAQEAVLNPLNVTATSATDQTRVGDDFDGLRRFIHQYVLPGTKISEGLFRKEDNLIL